MNSNRDALPKPGLPGKQLDIRLLARAVASLEHLHPQRRGRENSNLLPLETACLAE